MTVDRHGRYQVAKMPAGMRMRLQRLNSRSIDVCVCARSAKTPHHGANATRLVALRQLLIYVCRRIFIRIEDYSGIVRFLIPGNGLQLSFIAKNESPFVDLSVGDIRWQIAVKNS